MDVNAPLISAKQFDEARRLYDTGGFTRSIEFLDQALEATGNGIPRLRGIPMTKAFVLYGQNLLGIGDFSGLEQFIEVISQLGLREVPEFKLLQVQILGKAGKTLESVQKATEFLKAQDSTLHLLYADFLIIRGYSLSLLGEIEKPVKDCEEAYAIFQIQDRQLDAGRAANILRLHLLSLGQYDKSKDWFLRANRILKDLESPAYISIVALHLGLVNYKLGNFSESHENLNKSFLICQERNWLHRQCNINIALGKVYRIQHKFKMARRHLTAGYSQAQKKSMAREEALALEFLGDVYRDEGKFTEAQRYYARTLAITEPLAPEGDIVSETKRRVGECHVLSGNLDVGEPVLEQALALARSQSDRFEEAVTL